MRKINKFKGNEDGQSLVEFALVLPILMLLVLGMIEFGWILNGQITVTNAARAGARAAAIDSTTASAVVTSALDGSAVILREISVDPTGDTCKVTVNGEITPIIGFLPASLVPDPYPLTAKAVMRKEN
jgi:Flp pilus assembly protein TadG